MGIYQRACDCLLLRMFGRAGAGGCVAELDSAMGINLAAKS